MKNTKAFIFDLDGTLVDSMGIWKQIDIDYLGKWNIPLPDDLQEKIEGFSFTQTAIYFKERFQIPDSIEQIKADWNAMTIHTYENDVFCKPGAKEILQYAKEKGIFCAIATSNSTDLVERVLKSNGIFEYIDTIVTGCDVGKSKPEPDVYLCAAKRLGIAPENCVVFEDIIAGIDGAHNAKMACFAMDDAYSKYQEKEKRQKADYYIYDFREAIEILERNE